MPAWRGGLSHQRGIEGVVLDDHWPGHSGIRERLEPVSQSWMHLHPTLAGMGARHISA